MSVLADMTKRAQARYELDKLAVHDPHNKAKKAKLKAQIAALTAKIEKAKSKKAPHKKGSSKPTKPKARKGSKKENQASSTAAMKPHQRAVQASKAKLPASKPTACVRCRRSARSLPVSQDFAETRKYTMPDQCWPIPTRAFDWVLPTLYLGIRPPLERRKDISMSVHPPIPGVTDLFGNLSRDIEGNISGFVAPGPVTVCFHWSTMLPGESIEAIFGIRRFTPNLVSKGTTIQYDPRYVGFGYRVEHTDFANPGPDPARCGLFYARGGSVTDLIHPLIHAIDVNPVRNFEGWFNGPDTNPWRLPFDRMPTPPKEATWIVSAVDWENRIEETEDGDNCYGQELPEWDRRFLWEGVPPRFGVPITVWGKTGRNVKPVVLKVRLEEEIWKTWRNARDGFHLRVRLKSQRTGTHAGRTGWLYTRYDEGLLNAKQVLVPKNRKPDPDMPTPVPPLDERQNPLSGKETDPYLRIGAKELGQQESAGVLRFLYLPRPWSGLISSWWSFGTTRWAGRLRPSWRLSSSRRSATPWRSRSSRRRCLRRTSRARTFLPTASLCARRSLPRSRSGRRSTTVRSRIA